MDLLDQLSLMNNTKRKIVCPMPLVWWDLRTLICHKSYPDTFRGIKINSKLGKRLAAGFKDEILYPLILAGWSASDENKRERFLGHIKIAEKNNVLDDVKLFLFKLRKQEFHYETDYEPLRTPP